VPENFSDLSDIFKGLFQFFLFSRNTKGEFTFISAEVETVLGYSAGEFQSNWREMLTEDLCNEDLWLYAKGFLEKNEPINYNLEIRDKQNKVLWLEVHEQPVLNKEGGTVRYDGVAVDISSWRAEEKKLKNREKRYREISQSSPVGIFHAGSDDILAYVNPAFQKITGAALSKTLGKPWWKYIHPEDNDMVLKQWKDAAQKQEETSVECRVIQSTGEVVWVQLRSRFSFDDNEQITFGTLENIHEQKMAREKQKELIQELLELKQKLEDSAHTDPLTDLPNRRAWGKHLEYETARFKRSGKPFSILLTDLDHFKKINDTLGHDAGDQILIQIARLMKNLIRQQDIVCRWGGEEFIALLPETPLEGAKTLAERIRAKVESHSFTYLDQEIPVTLSIGLSSVTHSNQNVNDAVKSADDCLYKAKHLGRNRVVSEL